jgi:membrane-associated protease RseP (regulator of RpoE activity)
MKPTILIAIFCSVLLLGCGHCVTFFKNDYQLGRPEEITVGSSIIGWSSGTECYDFGGSKKEKYGIQCELVFCGVAGNVLELKYREYSIQNAGTYARDSYYLDLHYNLSPSPMTIVFQNVKIDVDSVDRHKMLYTVIQGPSRAELEDNSGRVGIKINADGVITEVVPNMPAANWGVRVGDHLLKINDEDIPFGNLDAILSSLAGPPGTEVFLTLKMGSQKSVIRLIRQRP